MELKLTIVLCSILRLASWVCRCPDRCECCAGTLTGVGDMQIPWPVSGVCRYPDQSQGCAGTLIDVRGVQVRWPVSVVCMYPDRYQRCAGTLTDVSGAQKLTEWVFDSKFPGVRPKETSCFHLRAPLRQLLYGGASLFLTPDSEQTRVLWKATFLPEPGTRCNAQSTIH